MGFELKIDKPCNERWESFKKTEGKGYCNSCEKYVIDFTKMTDEEIKNYFKNSPPNICGRLNIAQLKPYATQTHKNNSLLHKAVGILIGVTLMTGSMQSMGSKLPASINITSPFRQNQIKHSADTVIQTGISGSVISKDGKPLPGINVVIKGTNLGTITDANGDFTISTSSDQPHITLVFSFIGMETLIKEIYCNKKSMRLSPTIMKTDVTNMTQVIVGGVHSQKIIAPKRWWWGLKRLFGWQPIL